MTAKTVTQTELTFARHLHATAERDVDRVLNDYTDESVLYTPQGVVRGLNQLRTFFENLFATLPSDWFESFAMLRRETEDDVAYILWQAKPHIPMATDTFIVRQGKIMKQTFVVYPAAS